MNVSAEEINELLEKLGSPMRVFEGMFYALAVNEMIRLIPQYIDKEIDKKIADREIKVVFISDEEDRR